MDKIKFVFPTVLIIVICVTGYSDAACGSNCLNSTLNSTEPACNETTRDCLYGCSAGFTGLQCLVPCEQNCLNCSINSSGLENETECNQCAPNYFKNGSGCELCNKNCQGNSYSNTSVCDRTNGSCVDGCINGFYGPQCDMTCSGTCLQNDTVNATVCGQTNGFCKSGCLEGYYGDQCIETCSDSCMPNDTSSNATCSQAEGYCDFGCVEGYYSDTCNETCSQFCEQNNDTDNRVCNQTNGHCERGCLDGYYDLKCDKACGAGCVQNASSNLPVCDAVDGSCNFGCDNSSFNVYCTGICSINCLENSTSEIRDCNETNGYCEFGCVNGYYGLMCDNECNSDCLENLTSDLPRCDQQDGTCTFGCKNETFGRMCDRQCDNKCVASLCERDGKCKGCRFNLYGDSCNDPCPVGCTTGTGGTHCYQNGTCILGCKTNFWGPTCRSCNDDCVVNASQSSVICKPADGFCLLGCVTGQYGITCSYPCPEQCRDNVCNQTSGQCLNTCNKRFYGEYCTNTCSLHCQDQDNICFPENGTCIAESCAVSWFGPRCEQKCPVNCMNETCDRNNGLCSGGCIAGYFGDVCGYECLEGTYGNNCETNCSLGCVNATCKPDFGQCDCVKPYIGARCDSQESVADGPIFENLPVVSGSVGGVAALLLIIGIVVLCMWRKKKKKEIVRRRKPKNRKAFSEVIRRTIFSTKSVAGPKRILIDNLLTRVKDMSEVEFETDFNDIEGVSVTKSVSEAKKAENLSKNCFVNVYPYDENRVVLRSLNLQESGAELKARYRKTMDIIMGLADLTAMEPDYINASFIEGYGSAKQRYIAAQGPISATTKDFWKMVFQEKVSVIVMMTELETIGLFKKYWPDVGKEDTYGDVKVHGVKQETYADFCLRTMTVECFDEKRPLKHLQFTSWPPDGPPPSSAGMIEFYHKFRSIEPAEDKPIIVHCTSGVGRTGCFIALDLLVDEGVEDHSVDVSQCVSKLREQRVNMVQKEIEYEFLYKTVAQVISLRSYPVDKDKLKKEWKAMKKDNDKLIHKTFEDITESITMDDTDYDSITRNGENVDKNREGSDIPEDRYRPKLPNEEYINAVYMDTYRKKNGMIMTQMPTPDTVNAFLRLICQEKCHVVVMMNDEDWEDTTQFKYWPHLDKSAKHGEIFVTTKEIMDRVSYLQIKLTLSDLAREDDPNNTFSVTLYQIATWKAGNMCPKNEVACLSLIREVLRETDESYEGRILVHCLNGSERSGLFSAVYILLEKLNHEREISVVNTVRQIKTRRATAIPNQEQFRFIYECLVSYLDNYATEIKFKPEETQKKKSTGSYVYAVSEKKKKKSAVLYSKPDKRRKVSANDKVELVNGDPAASGSGVQPLYAVVDKKATQKTDSKGEQPMSAMVDNNGKSGTESEATAVSVEDINEVSISMGENTAERESNP